jgi:hypothetical protein
MLLSHGLLVSVKSDVVLEASKVLCNLVVEADWHPALLNLGISGCLITVSGVPWVPEQLRHACLQCICALALSRKDTSRSEALLPSHTSLTGKQGVDIAFPAPLGASSDAVGSSATPVPKGMATSCSGLCGAMESFVCGSSLSQNAFAAAFVCAGSAV